MAICASLKKFYTDTNTKGGHGRFKKDVSQTRKTLDMAVGLDVSAKEDGGHVGRAASLAAQERLIGRDAKEVSKGRKRYELWMDGDGCLLEGFKARVRKDKLPDEWLDWIQHGAWLHEDITRPSEGMGDSKNRHDRVEYFFFSRTLFQRLQQQSVPAASRGPVTY
jgi:hypothetical protein